MVIRVSRFDPSQASVWLNYEKTTGNWYKWDSGNKKHTLSSSSFFNWDRKTENVEDEELASDDECVFMDFAPNGLLSPYYLAGYVHRYTYLKTSSDDEEDSERRRRRFPSLSLLQRPLRKVRIIPSVLFYHTLRTAEKLR